MKCRKKCLKNTLTGPTKNHWRSNRGKSRQISANLGKFRFKNNGDHFFKKIATDRIAEGLPKNNGNHFEGEIKALFGVHHFSERRAIFFPI